MKLRDALMMGFKNIKGHLKRSLLVMGAIGVIFGLIFIIILWLKGLEDNYIQQAGWATAGRVIMVTSSVMDGYDDGGVAVKRSEIVQDAGRFGGKVIGEVEFYGVNGAIVMDPEYLAEAVIEDISGISLDMVPVLVSTTFGEWLLGQEYSGAARTTAQKKQSYEKFREALMGKTFTNEGGEKYLVVGLAPGGFAVSNLSFSQVERGDTSLLNPLLEMIGVPNATLMALENGGEWENNIKTMDKTERLIVVFDDARQAYEYFEHGEAAFMNVELAGKRYSATTLAGMAPDVWYILKVLRLIANVACLVLAAVAVIVAAFATIRLVDESTSDVVLYYSLGATARQVQEVYLAYFGLLVLGAMFLALGMAFAVVLMYSIANQEMLGVLFMTAFSLSEMPCIVLCGLSWEFVGFVVLMFLVPPIGVLVNRKQLVDCFA